MRRSPILLLAIGGLSFPCITIADSDSFGRNRELETAVVQRLLEQGFGRTSRITALGPATDLYSPPSPDPFSSRRYDYRWAQSSRDRGSQQAIAAQLQETIPGGRDLHVLVQNGQAFLFGRVSNRQQRERAEEIAQEAEGIERVRNQLTVAEQGWVQQEDVRIEKTIEEDLSRSLYLEAGRIQVDVSQGIAILGGTVDSFSELVVAVESAFRGGARSVRNRVQITGRSGKLPARDASGGGSRVESDRPR